MTTRDELTQAIGDRYRHASAAEKKVILNEFVAVTGYHRKHAIRVLRRAAQEPVDRGLRAGRGVYGEAVRQVLVILWEASDRVCGKRLRALLPALVDALERHGHLRMENEVRTRVLSASAATIDRLLKPARGGIRKRVGQRHRALLRRQVAVRTCNDWNDPRPGYVEGDLVAHCGSYAAGSYVHTLTITDVASGWTECVALIAREAELVTLALDQLQKTMPFPLHGFDSDNGSEFLNDTMIEYCTEHGIEFTRSRPYRKNDQAWVEQKNGAVVRRLVGYRRLEGFAATEALARLYASSRLFVNFFQPSFKLASKARVGSKVIKSYHPPQTPCARLLASAEVPESVKDRLRLAERTLDPLRLLGEIRAMQQHIVQLADGLRPHVPPADADLEELFRSLANAWRDGEVRPTHRANPKPQRYWRTRKDPFEAAWPTIREWLEAQPEQTAKEVLERLQREQPGVFPDGQLRTLQRRVHEWRAAAARQFIAVMPVTVAFGTVAADASNDAVVS